MNKPLRLFLLSAALVIGLTVASGIIIFGQFAAKSPSVQDTDVVYELASGKSLKIISNDLHNLNVITNPLLFSLYARIRMKQGKLKTGEYLLKKNMKPDEILTVLTSGRSIERTVTFSEGLNIFEISEIFEKNNIAKKEDFLKLANDKELILELLGESHTSLEGYLYPETYKYTKYTPLKDLLKLMVKNSLEVISNLPVSDLKNKFTRHQLVTLASIVEKETGAAHERPLIASVFHNRLKIGMRLQTDPTVLYAKILRLGFSDMNITKKDLQTKHPYNTYTEKGLPPGPISNPGKEALLASIQPQASNFLYFVSKNDGTHIFTSTFQEHNKAVRNFQINPAARAGKSWRDLQN